MSRRRQTLLLASASWQNRGAGAPVCRAVPIFAARCTPCFFRGSSGSLYEDAFDAAAAAAAAPGESFLGRRSREPARAALLWGLGFASRRLRLRGRLMSVSSGGPRPALLVLCPSRNNSSPRMSGKGVSGSPLHAEVGWRVRDDLERCSGSRGRRQAAGVSSGTESPG